MKDISQNDIQNNIPLVTREEFDRDVDVNGLKIGGKRLTIMAGPCTVESRTQIFEIAKAVKEAGAHMMRGGVFKPLTFPYGDPIGVGDADTDEPSKDRMEIIAKNELYQKAEKRFGYFKEAGEKYGLPIISEILYADSVDMLSKYVDMFQIGYRHMFNMDLVEAIAKTEKPFI